MLSPLKVPDSIETRLLNWKLQNDGKEVKKEIPLIEDANCQLTKENEGANYLITSYDIKLLNSYITNIPKHSSAQIKSVPTFFFNTQLKVPDLKRFHYQLMRQNEEKQKKILELLL